MRPSKAKSRRQRRVHVKTPGGVNKVHYKDRVAKKQYCANCGKELMGIPRLKSGVLAKTAKTLKRPQRAFGGVYCSRCSRDKIVEAARK